ncbi:MAG: DUF4278 domain-containing protein [Xenococcaceae cyanobacterium MO_234.B1]|nr:DUF4278 domain-containing protein [Xenococcaceae cyanobacterium MO_234.B1]
MELQYRGIPYQQSTNNQVKTVESRITAKFLGKTYILRRSYLISSSQLGLCKYRGVSY